MTLRPRAAACITNEAQLVPLVLGGRHFETESIDEESGGWRCLRGIDGDAELTGVAAQKEILRRNVDPLGLGTLREQASFRRLRGRWGVHQDFLHDAATQE